MLLGNIFTNSYDNNEIRMRHPTIKGNFGFYYVESQNKKNIVVSRQIFTIL